MFKPDCQILTGYGGDLERNVSTYLTKPIIIKPPPSSVTLSFWGNKKWEPQYKGQENLKISEKNWLNRLQMIQFECPRH